MKKVLTSYDNKKHKKKYFQKDNCTLIYSESSFINLESTENFIIKFDNKTLSHSDFKI